jgi:hypothetical protein
MPPRGCLSDQRRVDNAPTNRFPTRSRPRVRRSAGKMFDRIARGRREEHFPSSPGGNDARGGFRAPRGTKSSPQATRPHGLGRVRELCGSWAARCSARSCASSRRWRHRAAAPAMWSTPSPRRQPHRPSAPGYRMILSSQFSSPALPFPVTSTGRGSFDAPPSRLAGAGYPASQPPAGGHERAVVLGRPEREIAVLVTRGSRGETRLLQMPPVARLTSAAPRSLVAHGPPVVDSRLLCLRARDRAVGGTMSRLR